MSNTSPVISVARLRQHIKLKFFEKLRSLKIVQDPMYNGLMQKFNIFCKENYHLHAFYTSMQKTCKLYEGIMFISVPEKKIGINLSTGVCLELQFCCPCSTPTEMPFWRNRGHRLLWVLSRAGVKCVYQMQMQIQIYFPRGFKYRYKSDIIYMIW